MVLGGSYGGERFLMSEVPLQGCRSRGVVPTASGDDFRHFLFHWGYRGISLIRNSTPLGPYSRTKPRALWCS